MRPPRPSRRESRGRECRRRWDCRIAARRPDSCPNSLRRYSPSGNLHPGRDAPSGPRRDVTARCSRGTSWRRSRAARACRRPEPGPAPPECPCARPRGCHTGPASAPGCTRQGRVSGGWSARASSYGPPWSDRDMGSLHCARASRVFDIREHLPRSVGVSNVHVNLHGAGRDVEAAGEPPKPDQVLQTLALAYERYTRGFERSFREREGHGVRGLKDCDHFELPHVPGYLPRNNRRKPTVSMVPCATTATQRLRPVTRYKSPNVRPPNPAVIMPDGP